MGVNFDQSTRAWAILDELTAVIEQGYEKHALQRSPHLTLLNEEWYAREMKPVMAKWLLLWLEANHVSGLQTEHMFAYITRDCSRLAGAVWDAAVEEGAAAREAELSEEGSRVPAEGTAARERGRVRRT